MNLLSIWIVLSKLWVVARFLIWLATLVLGASVLVWVVDRYRGTDAELVIHVTEPDVRLTVGDQLFTIQGLDPRPIVCYLVPGSYVMTLSRDDRVLYEETVVLGPGESRVCTAYDPERYRDRQVPPKNVRLLRAMPGRKR